MKISIKPVLTVAALACGMLIGAAQGAWAACVVNATDKVLVFTVDAVAGADRVLQTLAPDQSLCLPETRGAVLHVYASETELEGCSRLVGPFGQDRLLTFARYDNCLWASQIEKA